MEQLQQIPWMLLLIASEVFLGGMFGVVLLLMKFPAARQLGGLLLTYLAAIVTRYFTELGIVHEIVLILLPILLYLYAYTFFSQKSRLSLLHLLPVMVGIGLLWADPIVLTVFVYAILGLYLVKLFRLLKQEGENRGFEWFLNPGARITWFRNFTTLNGTLLIVVILMRGGVILMALGILLVLIMVVYQVVFESNFLTPIPIGNKYQKSTLTPQIKAAVLEKIEAVMEGEFYLRDDVSLTNLAGELGVTTHHLSQVLNESLKISFQDLIARYRIRRACQILRDEHYKQVKIESVAAMVGYNSKSSFNSAFKKRTGLTPTEYREAKDVRPYGETPLSERERPSNASRKFSLNPVFNLKINRDMIRFSLRSLRKQRLHSVLNILGLAIGLSACLTIAAYVHYELSYDRHHIDPENTYRIALNRIYPDYNKEWAITAPVLTPTLTDDLPEVLSYTRLVYDDFMFGRVDDKLEKQLISAVDSGFFDVFKADIIAGNVTNDFFKKADEIILTETAARKYFGNQDPVGQLFIVQSPLTDEKKVVSVVALISDPIANTHFNYEILSSIKLMSFPDWMMTSWGTWGVYSYIRVHPETDLVALREKINAISEKNQAIGDDTHAAWISAGNYYDYFLQPLTDIHLKSNLVAEFEANSNELFVYFFALVGVFILLMAIVNFVNLATARASYRTMEVGIRKSVGASRSDLIVQFLFESILVSLIATLIALPLTQLFIPQFNQIIGKAISLSALLSSPVAIVLLVLTPIILGVLSGFYPALYLSNFSPSAVFQKTLVRRGRESLRHLLVVGQFIIAVMLTIGTITVYRQMHYLVNKPLGFDKEQLVTIDKLPFIGEKIGVFKEEVLNLKGVKGVAISNFPLDGIRAGSTISRSKGQEGWINTSIVNVDEDYLPTMGIQLVAGRNFFSNEIEASSEGVEKILLNVAAVEALGWSPDEAVNQVVYEAAGFSAMIVGVVENFNFGSLHTEVEPFQLSSAKFGAPFRSVTIKVEPRRMKEVIGSLEKVWSSFAPDKVMDFDYMDESMAQFYEAERLTGKLFVIFSLLGIFVCCLGLFGLMGYVVEKRSKEVGIRKVMGARNLNIIMILSKDYLRLVIISAIVAIPIAWWGLNQWLDSFAYRIVNSVWIFLLAGFLVTIVSWITVAFYALKAAQANPVHSLRSE